LVPEPAALAKKGKTEAEKAKKFYAALRQKAAKKPQRKRGASPKKAKDSFEFKVYKELEVKESLERLFLGKCAYCESRYLGTQPQDVEHWRPKGMIVEVDDEGNVLREIKPGYYWLAAVWGNLLPSCIDCNRQREQTFVLPDTTTTKKVVGKANQFPLAQDSPRATDENPDVEQEQPLLLNPCRDQDPGDYLVFDPEDAVVRPQEGPGYSDKASASILVYGLNRLGLVQERKEVLLLLKHRMYTIERLAWLLEDETLGSQSLEIVEDLLSHELEGLRQLCAPDRPYTLMTRQVIDKFFRDLIGEPAWT
jgi:hypothetical protein